MFMYMFTGQENLMLLHHKLTPMPSNHPLPHLDVEVKPLEQLTFGLLLGSLACFFLKYIL